MKSKMKVSDQKLKHIMRLLPEILVYHYLDWEFETQAYELPETFSELDHPFEIKNILWYDDLHNGIIHQVAEAIREFYYPKDKPREIWFMTVKALALRHLEIPPMEDWDEEAEELGIDIEDTKYYKKLQSAREITGLSHIASFYSSEAVQAIDLILLQKINEELIANKNKGKRKKAKGFKSS